MAKNDYFVIVYKILTYLYECLKSGAMPDIINVLNHDTYNIPESYFAYIMSDLAENDYIEGAVVIPTLNGQYINMKISPNIRIKPKGIEYLSENTMLKKAKKTIKDIKDIIPGL